MLKGRLLVGSMLLSTLLFAGCMNANPSPGSNVSGCSSSTNQVSFGGEFASNSGVDNCSFTNSDPKGAVSLGGQVSAGSVAVTIKDASGITVFSQTFSQGNSGTNTDTAVGAPGTWTVTFQMSGYTGNMGITVSGTAT
ncbi:MAG: hypothetical protein ACYDDF_09645 [Thermoplasmatota archaeon]